MDLQEHLNLLTLSPVYQQEHLPHLQNILTCQQTGNHTWIKHEWIHSLQTKTNQYVTNTWKLFFAFSFKIRNRHEILPIGPEVRWARWWLGRTRFLQLPGLEKHQTCANPKLSWWQSWWVMSHSVTFKKMYKAGLVVSTVVYVARCPWFRTQSLLVFILKKGVKKGEKKGKGVKWYCVNEYTCFLNLSLCIFSHHMQLLEPPRAVNRKLRRSSWMSFSVNTVWEQSIENLVSTGTTNSAMDSKQPKPNPWRRMHRFRFNFCVVCLACGVSKSTSQLPTCSRTPEIHQNS